MKLSARVGPAVTVPNAPVAWVPRSTPEVDGVERIFKGPEETWTLSFMTNLAEPAGLTVKVKLVVWVRVPAVPVMVMRALPVRAVAWAVRVKVELQVGLQAVGEKDAERPVGIPEADHVMDWVLPEERVELMVLVTCDP